MNSLIKRSLLIVTVSTLLGSCAKQSELSNAELIRNAYLDVIEATEAKIRPLVNLSELTRQLNYRASWS